LNRRSESDWIGPTGRGKDAGINYWRSQVRRVFKDYPGRKTDSSILSRYNEIPPCEFYVIVASTGGKWGKSRRDFPPVTN
jgi:hypothetical protein